jgi:2-phosphosulfolactate phosphatase
MFPLADTEKGGGEIHPQTSIFLTLPRLFQQGLGNGPEITTGYTQPQEGRKAKIRSFSWVGHVVSARMALHKRNIRKISKNISTLKMSLVSIPLCGMVRLEAMLKLVSTLELRPMKFSRLFLNRLQNQPITTDTVVVIDVLRSFTTAAVVLARGAQAIYPVERIATATELLGELENTVSIGAVGGGDPVPGFDFGNSPSQLMSADLAGKNLVMTTAAGVRGLQRFRRARQLYAASLVCARATAEAIRATDAEDVCFVITGEWVDRDGDEDIACADYIEALLRGEMVAPEEFSERVRKSDFGQRFMAGTWPNLPLADLDIAAQADLFAFAMPVLSEGDRLVIR